MLLRHLVVVVITSILTVVSATSTSRNRLVRIENIQQPSIDSPSSGRITALSHLELSFAAFGRRFRLSLEPNHDIIPESATINILGENGEIEHSEPINRLDHLIFKGLVRAQNLDGSYSVAGGARITVLQDGGEPSFEGAFDIHDDHHHILLTNHYLASRHQDDPDLPQADAPMVIFRDSDLLSSGHNQHIHTDLRARYVANDHVSCLADKLDFNMDEEHPVYKAMNVQDDEEARYWSMQVSHLFGKRQLDPSTGSGNSAGVNLVSTIGQTTGCFTTRKIALVGVATDCTYTSLFNGSTEAVRTNIITQFNSASSLYEKTFNISLGIQNITISKQDCPGSASADVPWNVQCSGNVNIQDRLNMFSSWRAKQQDTNSHWTLLTNCNSGTAVGLAWLGQACVVSAEAANNTVVAGANVVAKTSTEWQVIA
jgi:Metallo-peptidase family M12/Reprolysin family propeptide